MIKSITSGLGIEVVGIVGSSSAYPYIPYINMSNPSAGMVRYNGNTSNFEVYDGFSWYSMTSLATSVSLDRETQSIIEWAKKKRNEEMERDLLAAVSPAVKDLIKQIEEKEEQILIIQKLLKEEIKIGTN